MNWRSIERDFINKLKDVYPASEASNIFYLAAEYVTGENLRNGLQEKAPATEAHKNSLENVLTRLIRNEPIQHIIGEAWFYDIPFFVNKDVLIPRSETEELVDWIIKDHKNGSGSKILDIGTGSGCIPVILKKKIPDAIVYTCDISDAAMQVARKNAARHSADINFLHLDFLDPNARKMIPSVDLIVSNPPYIPLSDKNEMHANVLEFEPHMALFVPNESPLLFYEAIAATAKEILREGGDIYLEIHESQGERVSSLFHDFGYYALVKKDMQGKDRMVKASKKGKV